MNGHEKQFTWYDMLDAIDFGRRDAISMTLKTGSGEDGNDFIKKLLEAKRASELTLNNQTNN